MSTGEGTIAQVLAGDASWAFECRDGFALAKEVGENAVDHTIGDPPYDEQTHEGARAGGLDAKETPIDFAPLPDISSFLPSLILCSKRWVVLFCTGAMLGDYKRAAGGSRNKGGGYIRDGYWHRTNGVPQRTGDRPAVACEAIAILHHPGGRMKWNRGGEQAFWEGPKDADPHRFHPTKKPLWLMEALIRDFTDPGDLILAPTAGEGTTVEAAIKLGRRCIACEIDPKYHAMGLERLRKMAARPRQQGLFGDASL